MMAMLGLHLGPDIDQLTTIYNHGQEISLEPLLRAGVEETVKIIPTIIFERTQVMPILKLPMTRFLQHSQFGISLEEFYIHGS